MKSRPPREEGEEWTVDNFVESIVLSFAPRLMAVKGYKRPSWPLYCLPMNRGFECYHTITPCRTVAFNWLLQMGGFVGDTLYLTQIACWDAFGGRKGPTVKNLAHFEVDWTRLAFGSGLCGRRKRLFYFATVRITGLSGPPFVLYGVIYTRLRCVNCLSCFLTLFVMRRRRRKYVQDMFGWKIGVGNTNKLVLHNIHPYHLWS